MPAVSSDREVDQHVLAEEERADDRQVGEAGQVRARAGAATGVPTKAAPMSAERPMPKMVSARPVATWLASSVRVSTAKISASAAPARAAATRPSVWLPVTRVTAKPVTAPASIMPSTPRFSTPDALDHELAQGGEQQRRGGGDDASAGSGR